MSNNKQSSVEYLATQILDNWNDIQQLYYGQSVIPIEFIIAKAKAMEKKQTVDFAEKAVRMVLNEDIQNPVSINQLYNETFGGDNE